MRTLLRWREFGAGLPYHAALVPVTETRPRHAPHFHADFHELVYVLAGHGFQHLDHGTQSLAPGDLIFVRPSDVHEFAAADDDDDAMELINVAFASERWRAFVDHAAVPAAAAWETTSFPVIVHDAQRDVGVAMARSLADRGKPPRRLDLIRLWTSVIPALESAMEAPDERPDWLVRACSAMYTEENLQAGLPRLRALAAVSAGHLSRSMAVYYGCAPVEFVNRVRLDHATNLLATTTDPVGRVAERCGFGSHAYFCGRFQERFGVTPRVYRNSARRAVVP